MELLVLFLILFLAIAIWFIIGALTFRLASYMFHDAPNYFIVFVVGWPLGWLVILFEFVVWAMSKFADLLVYISGVER